MVENIIEYERNPVVDSNFYKNATLSGSLIDRATPGPSGKVEKSDSCEDDRFIKTLEEIRENLIANNISVRRIYNKNPENADIEYWNPYYTEKRPTRIPDELMSLGWKGTKTDIVDAVNNGTFLLLYNGHSGNNGTILEPLGLQTFELGNTTNGKRRPLFISTGCTTGTFAAPITPFGVNVLGKTNGGMISMIAPTGKAIGDLCDVLLAGMVNAIFPVPDIRQLFYFTIPYATTPKPTYRLGQILDQGLYKMKVAFKDKKPVNSGDFTDRILKTYRTFHCLGDPSLRLYTAVPLEFSNVTFQTRIERRNNISFYAIDVNSDMDEEYINKYNVKINCYDKQTGRMTVYNWGSASFNYIQNLNDVVISITGINHKPYIIEFNSPFRRSVKKTGSNKKYESLIREDRIWEYRVNRPNTEDADNFVNKIIRAKFDGTVEIGGKEYHKFMSVYVYCDERHAASGSFFYESETPMPIAYMREENGKYYMLLPEREAEHENLWKVIRDFYGSTKNEYMVFDFNDRRNPDAHWTPEECGCFSYKYSFFEGLTPEQIEEEERHLWSPDGIDYSVMGISSLAIPEWWESSDRWYEVRCLKFSKDLQENWDKDYDFHLELRRRGEYGWIEEGVGCLDSLLPFPCVDNYVMHWYDYWDSDYIDYIYFLDTYCFSLYYVYDLDGNVIYTGYGEKEPLDIRQIRTDGPEVRYTEKGLEVNGLSGKADVEIYSHDGRLIRTGVVDPQNPQMSLEGLASGLYIVTVGDGMARTTLRIVLK